MPNITFDPAPMSQATADKLVRGLLGPLCFGVSAGPKKVKDAAGTVLNRSVALTVHLLDSVTPDDLAKLESAIQGYGSMAVTADKTAIQANDTDAATITCAAPHIATDTKVDVRVFVNGAAYHEGVADVTAGSVVLELATETPGVYLVVITRRKGNFASGVIQIEAV